MSGVDKNNRKRLIWVLLGIHPGDNAQAKALAAQLGGEVVEKPLKFSAHSEKANWRLGATLASLEPECRSQITGPWPDMVIATGKRTVPVSRWIKKQSGGKTKLVQLGRPRARLSAFDLVITTPQYHLPAHPQVIEMSLPFAQVVKPDEDVLKQWGSRWQHLPKPWIAVFLGGEKLPMRFGEAEARELAQRLEALAKSLKASVILMGSPRTGNGMVGRIAAELSVPHVAYPVFDPQNNPYQSALQMADYFVVTSDSLSMLSEATKMGKSVYVFALPVVGEARRWQDKKGIAGFLTRQGILVPKRRISDVVERLIDEGQVGVLGEKEPMEAHRRDDGPALARVKALLE